MPTDLTKMEDWFCSASGRRLFVSAPEPKDIHIEDIAHGLSHVCRFGGHVQEFYSVAQHSVLVSHHVPAPIAREALLHDAAEAFIGDVIHPLKQCLPDYKRIERMWEHAIAETFNLGRYPAGGDSDDARTVIKRADLEALVTERRDVCHPAWARHPWKADEAGIAPWSEVIRPLDPVAARAQFLMRWEQLDRLMPVGRTD